MTGESEGSATLPYVPMALFTATMGLTGLGLGWRAARDVLGWPGWVGEAILVLAVIVFALSVVVYGAKILRYPRVVAREFADPVQISFFPAFSISLLLLATAALPYSRDIGAALWFAGATLQLPFALAAVNRWITHNFEIQLASPAWFIPAVGNVLVSFAGAPLGHVETSWFFFSVGMVFWLVLLAIVLYRIIFHDQLPDRYLPTLFILMVPPAAGFIGYTSLNGGELDYTARVLFHFGLFIAMLLFTMTRQFLRLPFTIGWLSYGFPAAAMAFASLRYHAMVDSLPSLVIAVVMIVTANVVIVTVFTRAAVALARGQLFTPE